MSYIDQITVGSTTYDIKDANAIAAPSSATTNAVLAYNGTNWTADKRTVILSYGSSTWQDFLNAFNNNAVIYCRASSNSNPASGSQTRHAFLAYVNNLDTPTEVEFQYYRSVSTHSDAQQGDQVFVYKLNSSGTWSVTTREAYTKIATSTGLSKSYSNGTLTITNTVIAPEAATATPLIAGTAAVGSSVKFAREDHVHPEQTTISGHTVASDVPSNAVFTDIAAAGLGITSASSGWCITIASVNSTGVPTLYSASPISADVEPMTAEEIWVAAASGWGSTNPSVAAAIWNSVAAGWSISATMTDSTIHTSVASGWR